ncbi:hypothetical protein JTB14_019607 [Gonioctena quinquepunctata]|nr:hypothetical protein JTB14_019607 [Gonioctena quinquepunctata]
MENQSFKLQKSKKKISIPVKPEIITKNLPSHIQFLVRQRNAVKKKFQQSKNRDNKIELLIHIKAIVIEMSSSQPGTLPNFISLVIKDSLKNDRFLNIWKQDTSRQIHRVQCCI